MYTDMYYMYMYGCLSSLQGIVLLSVYMCAVCRLQGAILLMFSPSKLEMSKTFTFSTNIFQFDLYSIYIYKNVFSSSHSQTWFKGKPRTPKEFRDQRIEQTYRNNVCKKIDLYLYNFIYMHVKTY